MRWNVLWKPLYRRGPNWSTQIHSSQWPNSHPYGPPISHDALPTLQHILEFDSRMFALYFVIAETFVTYLGYCIVQQLMRGRQLPLWAPKYRFSIALLYCTLKLRLVDYAFHGTLYLIVSTIVSFIFITCSLLAIAFHFGPLRFVFVDAVIRRKAVVVTLPPPLCRELKQAKQSPFHVGLRFIVRELKYFFVKQHLHEFSMELAKKTRHEQQSPAPIVNGSARVTFFFGGVLEIVAASWNEWITHHAFAAIISAGSKKKKVLPSDVSIAETRFIVLMQTDGLILDFIIREPTATLLYRLKTNSIYPVELVLRYLSTTGRKQPRPVFMYATSVKLLGNIITKDQKTSLLSMLYQLNRLSGHKVDVPLRSLRCKDFIVADCHKQQSLKRERSQSLTSEFENTFG